MSRTLVGEFCEVQWILGSGLVPIGPCAMDANHIPSSFTTPHTVYVANTLQGNTHSKLANTIPILYLPVTNKQTNKHN